MIAEDSVRAKILADLFEFDAAVDSERKSEVPVYREEAGGDGSLFRGVEEGRAVESLNNVVSGEMSEKGFRENVMVKFTQVDKTFEIFAEKIKELESRLGSGGLLNVRNGF